MFDTINGYSNAATSQYNIRTVASENTRHLANTQNNRHRFFGLVQLDNCIR
jgi:hypothetical protein